MRSTVPERIILFVFALVATGVVATMNGFSVSTFGGSTSLEPIFFWTFALITLVTVKNLVN